VHLKQGALGCHLCEYSTVHKQSLERHVKVRFFELSGSYRISESLITIFWVKILKFFDADPGWKKFESGIRDGKNSDPGSGINIPDSQYCFLFYLCNLLLRTLKYFNSALVSRKSGSRILLNAGPDPPS
jgi:hypothetical protein